MVLKYVPSECQVVNTIAVCDIMYYYKLAIQLNTESTVSNILLLASGDREIQIRSQKSGNIS
jgi:hypothetical protein